MGCDCGAYGIVFNSKGVRKEQRKFKKKGLPKESSLLYGALKDKVNGKKVFELGSGSGVLPVSLARHGVKEYTGFEISRPSVIESRKFIEEEGLSEKIRIIEDDFVRSSEKYKKADVILSDKVVCCYPDMEGLINATASHAKKYYGIVYPKSNFLTKAFVGLTAMVLKITPARGFRAYVHDTAKINEIIRSYGFRKIFHENTFVWEILLFER